MTERLSAEASSGPSILLYGLHNALLLVNGLGQAELAPAYDPRPRRRNTSRHGGDPFEDPNRALHLTIASDCRWLGEDALEEVVRLGGYPNVTVDLSPGLPTFDYSHAHSVTAKVVRSGVQHVEVRTTRLPTTVASGILPSGGADALRRVLGISAAEAQRLAIDVAIHEGLGNDYLVSALGVRARAVRRAGWPNQVGFCSPEEASGLVGAKSRMYEIVPLDIYPPASHVNVNVGRWRDQAALWSCFGLRRALAGALGPDAISEETATVGHLLAIRALLVDALIARDAVYRLTRHDAIEERTNPFSEAPVPGARGNDLTQLLRYHAVTMLNHVFSITDNLSWVAVRRTGAQIDREYEVGLAALVGPRKKTWAKVGPLGKVSQAMEASPDLSYILAVRTLRNASVHREGVEYGSVEFRPPPSPPLRRVLAFWLDSDAWNRAIMREVGDRAELNTDEVVIVSFLRLVDELWRAVVNFVNHGLSTLEWSSGDWIRGEPEYKRMLRPEVAWRGPRQPLMFRFP